MSWPSCLPRDPDRIVKLTQTTVDSSASGSRLGLKRLEQALENQTYTGSTRDGDEYILEWTIERKTCRPPRLHLQGSIRLAQPNDSGTQEFTKSLKTLDLEEFDKVYQSDATKYPGWFWEIIQKGAFDDNGVYNTLSQARDRNLRQGLESPFRESGTRSPHISQTQ